MGRHRQSPSLAALPQLIALGSVPAILFAAHFAYGAILPLPAVVLSALLSAALLVGLTRPDLRRQLEALRYVRLLAVLFGLTVVAALWSLTPWTPGGAHPIWEWAGFPPAATINRSATLLEIVKLTGLASAFGLGVLMGLRALRARMALVMILGMGAVYALVALILFVTKVQVGGGEGRLLGGFYTPNTAATVFGVLSAIALAWLLRGWRTTRGHSPSTRTTTLAPPAGALLLFLGCLVLTASRSAAALTALALAGLLIADALNAKGRSAALLGATALVFGTSVAALLVADDSLVVVRLLESGLTDDARATLNAASWRAFLDSPLTGYGLGTYPEVSNQSLTSANYDALAATTVLHQTYLQWLVEAGLIGAAPMFLAIAAILVITAFKTIAGPRNRTLLMGLLASSVIVLGHAAFDVSLHTPSFASFWALLLGLGFSLSQAPTSSR